MGLLHCFGWDREGAQLRGPAAWPVTITGESSVITYIFCCGCFGEGGWQKGSEMRRERIINLGASITPSYPEICLNSA